MSLSLTNRAGRFQWLVVLSYQVLSYQWLVVLFYQKNRQFTDTYFHLRDSKFLSLQMLWKTSSPSKGLWWFVKQHTAINLKEKKKFPEHSEDQENAFEQNQSTPWQRISTTKSPHKKQSSYWSTTSLALTLHFLLYFTIFRRGKDFLKKKVSRCYLIFSDWEHIKLWCQYRWTVWLIVVLQDPWECHAEP